MANKVVIFPETKHSAANAYKAACDAHYASAFEPGGTFAYLRIDAYGQWVVPYYGAPWEFTAGQPFTAPSEVDELRAEGVLHDFAIWPEE